MTLSAGTRFGVYEVVSLLGVGGMGEVYRATDSRLHRDVALKVLPDVFASDPDRLARFQREAQVLASLNHPHIGAIHGLEQSGSIQALVLELVDGPTLAERIAHGPIPTDEALPIARQIAEALEAAHERGIVHRDLKPANIKLRADGTAKVLDFGLAKALEAPNPAASSAGSLNTPTITSPAMMTAAGIILGTAAYMSPEQVKGSPADRRSDVWAFGCVLYEMLSGFRAFAGDDVADTLAGVLRGEPRWEGLPSDVPDPVRRLLRRCLEKDRRRRLPDIAVVRQEIDEALLAPVAYPDPSTRRVVVAQRPLWQRAWPVVLSGLVAGALAAWAGWTFKPDAPRAVLRSRLELSEIQQVTPARRALAISPDGMQMVFAANRRLYLRRMSELDATPIPGSDVFQGTPTNPIFSPDSQSIAFVSSAAMGSGTLHRLSASGGPAIALCQIRFPNSGMSWSENGIIFGHGTEGIFRIGVQGGQPQRLIAVKEGEEAAFPVMLPGNNAVLYTLATSAVADRWDNARIVVQAVGSTERKVLVEGGSDATYVPSGHLVFAQAGTLFAVPFDPARREVTGEKVPVIQGVRRGTQGAAHFAVSRTGTLVYLLGPAFGLSAVVPRELLWIDRKGKVEPARLPSANYVAPRISPDGTQLAFGTEDPNEAVVWVADLSGQTPSRRFTYGGKNRYPIWVANGDRIVFQSDREGDLAIFSQRADGTDTAVRLTRPAPGVVHVPESWSREGGQLSFSAIEPSGVSLWTLSLADKTPVRFGDVRSSSPFNSEFSPDGKRIAYTLRSSSDASVFVEPFPATGAKNQIARDTSHHPLWSHDGKELSYRMFGELQMVVRVSTQPRFSVSNPVRLPGDYPTIPYGTPRNLDMMPDGRFVVASPASQAELRASAPREIHVVVNWFEELKRSGR